MKMKKRESGSIFIITSVDLKNRQEYIVFINFKEEYSSESTPVELIYENEIYEDENYKFKQRFFVGEKEEVKKLYKNLVENKFFQIGKDCFYLCCEIEVKNKIIGSYPIIDRNDRRGKLVKEYTYEEYENLEKTDFIYIRDGFSKIFKRDLKKEYADEIEPYGYISLKNLDQYIQQQIIIRCDNVVIENNWGVKSKEVAEPLKNFKGIIDYTEIPLENLRITLVKNEEEVKELKETDWVKCDKGTGYWEIDLEKNLINGIILYKDIENNKIIFGDKIGFTTENRLVFSVLDGNLIDGYNEEISYEQSKRKKSRVEEKLTGKTFFRESYPAYSDKEYSQEISVFLEKNLEVLGDEILIVDPYLLGEIKNDKYKKGLLVDLSQIALINALVKTLVKIELKSIKFIFSEKFKYELDVYAKLKEDFKKLQKDICIEIIEADISLHDRYIMGVNTENVLVSTKSMNGLTHNGEVTFTPLDKKASKMVVRKYLKVNRLQKL